MPEEGYIKVALNKRRSGSHCRPLPWPLGVTFKDLGDTTVSTDVGSGTVDPDMVVETQATAC
jgi:hypothetical protein